MASPDPMVAALLREREGYIARGLTARVELVDEQLRLRGHEPVKSTEPDKAPKGRKAPPRRTTSAS